MSFCCHVLFPDDAKYLDCRVPADESDVSVVLLFLVSWLESVLFGNRTLRNKEPDSPFSSVLSFLNAPMNDVEIRGIGLISFPLSAQTVFPSDSTLTEGPTKEVLTMKFFARLCDPDLCLKLLDLDLVFTFCLLALGSRIEGPTVCELLGDSLSQTGTSSNE